MLETLSQLMLNRNFMVDLWVNFDCDPESEDVFERMIDFLTKVRVIVEEVKLRARLKIVPCLGRVCILRGSGQCPTRYPIIWTTASFSASKGSSRS